MGTAFLILYLILGAFLGLCLFDGERPLKRVWLGAVAGMMLLMWSHVPFSFVMGFTVGSHLLGLLLSVIIVGAIAGFKCGFFTKNRLKRVNPFENVLKPLEKSEWAMVISVVPILIVSIVLLSSHTLRFEDGAYYTGQCTYGDMNMHLGFITSIGEQHMFPPTYSIAAGEPLNYPFMCDSISSSVYIFGDSLKTSYMAPMIAAFLLVYMGVWYVCEAILKKPGRTALAFYAFLLDGGFGFIYFVDGWKSDKTNFTRIFTAFYETPTNYVAENVRWTNVIVDMLLPQRATIFGWTCLFAVIYVLLKAVFDGKDDYFLIAGVMAGLLPMIHTHSYFAVGLIAIAWIIVSAVREKCSMKIIKSWMLFGIPALVLSVPQLLKWTFNAVGGESFLRFTFNWVNSTGGDSWLWFWVKNLGLVFLLIPTAFFHADKKKKCIYSGAFLIFLISEFIIFQPNLYDNIKLFFIWYLFMAIMVADLLADCYIKLKDVKGIQVVAVLIVLTLVISGALSVAREYVSGTKEHSYQLYNERNTAAALWAKENTPAGSTFLCWNNHNNALSSLSGRNIYVGAGTFLYYHGVNYQEREALMKQMFSDAQCFEENKGPAGIDYVYIGDYENANLPGIITDYFEATYEKVYDQNGTRIFKIT